MATEAETLVAEIRVEGRRMYVAVQDERCVGEPRESYYAALDDAYALRAPKPALSSEEAYATAKHRARYAHKKSVVWKAADGWHVAEYGRDAVRAAMLAVGTAGKFAVVGSGATVRTGWRTGVRQLRTFALAGA